MSRGFNGLELELRKDYRIAGDFAGAGKALPMEQELYGLVGKTIVIKGYRNIDPDDWDEVYVTEIEGKPYLNSKIRLK